LKPLAGADDDLPRNLDSFAALDYPAYEVLLGVASMDDPAAAIGRAFLRRHPRLDGRLVVTDPDAAVNPKVAQLIALEREATGEVVVVSDSNVRVPEGYLWSLVQALAEPRVGLVTSIFVGTGERSVGAALENLQLGSVTAPGVVAAARLLREPLTVGKSMAMRRRDLAVMGALHAVKGVLAEDHALGRLFLAAGYEVRTSLDPIENRNVDCSIARTLERHSRWAKMRRSIAPVPFALEPLLSPLAIASLVALVAQSRTSLWACVVTALLQTLVAFASIRALRGRSLAWYYAPLEILRTYLTLLCWGRAWFSRRIAWRGHAFLLAEGSVIVPAPPSSWSRLIDAVRA
jgi:ceramide glucosyltransferase